MAKRPIAENPLEDMDITNLVRNITSGTDIAEEAPKAEEKEEEPKVVSPQEKEKTTTQATALSSAVRKPTSPKPERPKKKLKPISKVFSDEIIENYLRYDKSSEKGKPIYVSSELINRLQEISEKYHKRLSARAITQALLETFFNEFDGETTVDNFMERIHYVAPSEEELEARRIAAEKARQVRAASK